MSWWRKASSYYIWCRDQDGDKLVTTVLGGIWDKERRPETICFRSTPLFILDYYSGDHSLSEWSPSLVVSILRPPLWRPRPQLPLIRAGPSTCWDSQRLQVPDPIAHSRHRTLWTTEMHPCSDSTARKRTIKNCKWPEISIILHNAGSLSMAQPNNQGNPPPPPQPPVVPQPMGQQNMNVNVGQELNDLCQEIKLSQLASGVRCFDGEGHQRFLDWLKDMDICRLRNGDDALMRSLTVATLTGPAADFILRALETTPRATWNQIKTCLKQRYSDLADVQYAGQSMRNLKQNRSEGVQNFGERIMPLAREAYPAQNLADATIQSQLIEIFASGLRDASIMRRVIRKRPADLDKAVLVAAEEQQAIKSFELNRNNKRDEPMEVDALQERTGSVKRQLENMSKQMLVLTECLQKLTTQGGSPNDRSRGRSQETRLCYNCDRPGHLASDCRRPRRANSNRSQPQQHQLLN